MPIPRPYLCHTFHTRHTYFRCVVTSATGYKYEEIAELIGKLGEKYFIQGTGLEWASYLAGKTASQPGGGLTTIWVGVTTGLEKAGNAPSAASLVSCPRKAFVRASLPKKRGAGALSVGFLGRRDRGHPPIDAL
jgi:hypothetical protein